MSSVNHGKNVKRSRMDHFHGAFLKEVIISTSNFAFNHDTGREFIVHHFQKKNMIFYKHWKNF